MGRLFGPLLIRQGNHFAEAVSPWERGQGSKKGKWTDTRLPPRCVTLWQASPSAPWNTQRAPLPTGYCGRKPNTMRQAKMKPNSPHRIKGERGIFPCDETPRSAWVQSAFQPIYSISLGYQGGNCVAFVSGLNCCGSIHPKQTCLFAS